MNAPRWKVRREGARAQPFDVLCRLLAARFGDGRGRAELHAQLAATGFDWQGLLACADRHLMVPALAAALADLDGAGTAPPGFVDLINGVREQNATRNRALRAYLLEVVHILNRIGIEPVLLKGAIRLVDDLYPDPSWRYMGDLDLLVADRAADAARALRAAGHADGVDITAPDPFAALRHHLPPLRRPSGPARIEIHTRPLLVVLGDLLTTAAVVASAEPLNIEGARMRIPGRCEQLIHVVGHWRGRPDGAYRLFLRDALETRLLLEAVGAEGRVQLIDAFDRAGRRSSVRFWLAAIDRHLVESNGPPPGRARVTSLGLRWMRLLERSAMLRAGNGILSHYVTLLDFLLGTEPGRRRLVRNLACPSFYRRQLWGLGRLLTQRWR